MSKKATSILCWFFGWIGWIIAYFVGDKEGAKFHLNQSLVYKIFCVIVAIASVFLSILMSILSVLIYSVDSEIFAVIVMILSLLISTLCIACSIFIMILWIMGLIHACTDEEKPLPLIGKFNLLK